MKQKHTLFTKPEPQLLFGMKVEKPAHPIFPVRGTRRRQRVSVLARQLKQQIERTIKQ